LVHAIERYQPERGLAFTTYAYHCIRGYMQRAADISGWIPRQVVEDWNRKGKRVPQWTSLEKRRASRFGKEGSPLATILVDGKTPAPDREPARSDDHRLLDELLGKLADLLGITRERVRQLEKRAWDRLQYLAERHVRKMQKNREAA
jgi:hypothetical protein